MIFTRSLTIFFSLSLGVHITFTKATTVDVVNQCPYTVWVAVSPFGGWQLYTDESRSFTVNSDTKISQIWGRTNCSVDDDGQAKCQTGDCSGLLHCQNLGSPPLTLAEINLNVDNNLDFLDISLVFGFNIPMSIGPATNVCRTIHCSGDIIEQCPEDLQAPGGCYSACKVFKTGEYCCPGPSCGPTEYSRFFKKRCPNAYTYPFDDIGRNFTCPAGTNYEVVFCPSKMGIKVHDHDSPQDYVNAHNAARTEVGVGPITWDNTVAAYAQNYANQHIGDCNLVHSGGPYGENLAMSSGDLSGTDAVKMWVDEKANYDHNSNSCAQGAVCRHYTQVVWRNSIRLGCAKVRCNNGGTFIGCNYDPAGNVVGQSPY